VELSEFVAALRARLRMVIGGALIAAAVAFIVGAALPPTFVASTQILIGPSLSASSRDPSQLQAASDMAQTYAIALQTQTTAQVVIDALHLTLTVDQLRSMYAVSLAANAPVITVSTSAGSAQEAADIANSLAEQLTRMTAQAAATDASLGATLRAQIDAVQGLIDATKARVDQLTAISSRTAAEQSELDQQVQQEIQLQITMAQLLTTASGSSYNVATVIDPATPPPDPASPKPLLDATLAFVLGGLVGVALAVVLATRSRDVGRRKPPSG
jgi:capsular polysaccharide biosynthesis protein